VGKKWIDKKGNKFSVGNKGNKAISIKDLPRTDKQKSA
jgi:hypothetical protein